MDSPGKRKRGLRVQLASLSKEMKAERERLARKDAHWKLHGTFGNTALAVYMLTDCAVQPVCEFLKRGGEQRGWDDLDVDSMLLLVVDFFLGRTTAELDAITNADNPLDQTALVRAHAFVNAFNMDPWTKARNNDGLEASTALVLDEMQRKVDQVNPTVRPPSWGVPEDGAARKRVHRWRKLRGGRFGFLPTEEDITTTEMREKAVHV